MNKFKVLLLGPQEALNQVNFLEYNFEQLDEIHIAYSQLKKIVRQVTRCDFVVTLNDWENDPKSVKAVAVARLLDIPVVHHSSFNKYVQSINN